MRIVFDRQGFKIERYEGLIEAVRVAKQFGDGAQIAYLRINEGSDGVATLQNFPAGNTVGSYLKEGTECVLFTLSSDGRGRLPFAVAVGARQVYDAEELDRLVQAVQRQLVLVWGSVALAGLLMCLLVLFIYFGIPLMVWAGWKLRKALSRTRFPFADMRAILLAEGWQLTKS